MTAQWPFLPTRSGNINIVRAEGAYLETDDGRRILDAAGGAIVANIGHGRKEVADAVAEATVGESYVVPPWSTPSRQRLADRLVSDWLPPELTHIHMTCGGSEGVESAMKIALQHHACKGDISRTKIIGRSISYHGTTLATTAVGGHQARRKDFEQVLADYPRAPTPYPLRCPDDDPGRYYVDALEQLIETEGPATIAAFLAEPVSGASGGAIVPPDDYWPGVQDLCDKHGILLIVDEVMTGFGRTGKSFGHQHWSIEPDIMVAGKGLAGGYAPLTGIFATDDVADPIRAAHSNVMFHTFGAHPAACAAADVVLSILTRENLVERARDMGEKLLRQLRAAFSNHPHVAEVRGQGMLLGVEVVKDRDTLEQFPLEDNVTNRIVGEALQRNVFFYGGGTGEVRDVIVLGPPFIIDDDDIDLMVNALVESVDAVVS